MLRPFQDKTAWLKPTAGLISVEGTLRHWLRGIRRTPTTSSAANTQVSARSVSRSTTSQDDSARAVTPSRPCSETQSWTCLAD